MKYMTDYCVNIAMMEEAIYGFGNPGDEDTYYARALECLDEALSHGEIDGKCYRLHKQEARKRYYCYYCNNPLRPEVFSL